MCVIIIVARNVVGMYTHIHTHNSRACTHIYIYMVVSPGRGRENRGRPRKDMFFASCRVSLYRVYWSAAVILIMAEIAIKIPISCLRYTTGAFVG